MKRFKSGVGIAIACVLVLSTAALAAPKFISIATGGTGGAYFPIGAGLADIINKKLTGYNASAEVTAASKVNCINVNDGKSDLALVLGDTLSYGYKGEKLGGFAKPLTNLRVIANIYPNTIQIVARKDSGIAKLSDLKGKKVSVGAPGSGTEINARQIFAAARMSYHDFGRTDYLSFSESADQMKNRAIDVTLISSGMPNPGIMDIATSQEITIVPIEGELLKVLDKDTPFFVADRHPEGDLQGAGPRRVQRGHPELPDHPRGPRREDRLRDHKGHVREPRPAGAGARGREGDQAGERDERVARAAAPRGGEVLPGEGPHKVTDRGPRGAAGGE